ncbi:M23 family metallopeptidase [Sphingosinithalassobacter portus]|uniref:M23 family metallopeptidase n=1 Tax=Stakelama portus TaxID=2676234 RepID=UPI001EFE645E|nr:M23 family metallopeptidase [Sphingosinithalassobacter portus]
MIRRVAWSLAALIVLTLALLGSMVRVEIHANGDAVAAPARAVSADRTAALQEVPVATGASADMRASGETAVADAGQPPHLVLPVQGVKAGDLYDSWGDPRGDGTRGHTGIDIMAPGGTPVLAAAPGTIEKLYFSHGGGGITIYERSTDGKWSFYYAHLGGYAPGIVEGKQVAAGDPIAYVGDTGNAGAGNHHLHFGVSRIEAGQGWWQGTPVNPYPLLAEAQSGG